MEQNDLFTKYEQSYAQYALKAREEIDYYTKIYNDVEINCTCHKTKPRCLECGQMEIAKNSLNFLIECHNRRIFDNEIIVSDPNAGNSQKLMLENMRKFLSQR